MEYPKKLIEVALPLEAINAEAAREKSIRHGHPSTLHLWWARRPLAAARAVIWSQLVDDPSSHPELFPTEEAQETERQRLFGILTRLVKWENSNDEAILAEAKAEIAKYTNGEHLALLDPFAGGGAIPLEAQRLGLEAHAHDLNPVAVMINKAMIEIPPMFAGNRPVNPEARRKLGSNREWKGATGLAEDVRYYGEWMKQEAFKRIGHLYPKVKVPAEQGGGEATVIAWIWARTVKCPNPACGCEMPLASSFVLSKKKGKEAWIDPVICNNNAKYVIRYGKTPKGKESVKIGKGGLFRCIFCSTVTDKSYIHEQFSLHKDRQVLIGIIAESSHGRLYLSPSQDQIEIAECNLPDWYPTAEMNTECTDLVSGRGYGFEYWHQLFTNRQLTTLTTFSGLVAEAQKKATQDALNAEMPDDGKGIDDGGHGATAYGQSIGVYLAFLVDQLTNQSSSVCGWNSVNTQMRCTFARQAIPMVWDFAECNIFSNSSGSYSNLYELMIKSFPSLGFGTIGNVCQHDAQTDSNLRNIVISTDPPYYDNISYADLSDYFYIWLRQSLKKTYPSLFRTMLVPKAEELVATPYRFEGSKERAQKFFEKGMSQACRQFYSYSRDDIPVTIYYAYKQSSEDEDGEASTGWETMLSAIINAGFSLTGTWPMRTEKPGRTIENGTNALASSIVLVCRKRPVDAPSTTRRDFIRTLKRELRTALRNLQTSNIAPVDLAQAAIGPGMGVFSRYSAVREADGTPMSVRSALQAINAELDSFFNEQDGALDAESRFCVDLYTQQAFNDIKFGEANVLANAKNVSVDHLAELSLLTAAKGIVRLNERAELPENPDGTTLQRCQWLLTQVLTRAMETGGVEACAAMAVRFHTESPHARELAYRLYTIAERRGWNNEAYAYNTLVTSWQDIMDAANELRRNRTATVQGSLV